MATTLLLTSCQPNYQKKSIEACDGTFFLRINNESQQTICSHQSGEYNAEKQVFQFRFTDKNIAGNTTIYIEIKPFNGKGIYRPSDPNTVLFDMQVKGATDELYHGFEGWIKVMPENSATMIATFEISLEGFYNKKIIHATGWMSIPESKPLISKNSSP